MDSPIVDAQIHVWGSSIRAALPDGAPTPPFLTFERDRVLELMDEAGVETAILIPPTWSGFGNEYALECTAAAPGRFVTVGRFDPTQKDARETLSACMDHPGLVGLRLVLTAPPGANWLQHGGLRSGALEWFWEDAHQLAVPLVLRIAENLDDIAQLSADFPELKIVIDHCAAQTGKTGNAFAGLQQLLALSTCRNVYVKFSGLPQYSTKSSPFQDIDDIIQKVVQGFGADRCMWGSDISQLIAKYSYQEVLDQFTIGCEFLAAEERESILGKTARAVFGINK